MRFNESNYLKAFPREEPTTTKVVIAAEALNAQGSVIEEALEDSTEFQDPEPENSDV